MKVLLATPFMFDPNVGGPAHTVATIRGKLAQAGVDTALLTGNHRRFPPPGPPVALRDVARADVVHNFGLWTPFSHAISRLTRVIRKSLVLAPLGMLEPWALAQSSWKKRLALLLYQRADLERATVIHATAKAEVESVRALGVRTPIALIPHGVEIPSAPSEGGASADARAERVMLFLSRIHPKKGLLDLVEAWAQLQPTGWRVIVAGPDEGGHRAQVEAAVRRHALERSFEFKGAVSEAEKRALLASADVFVLPTYSENFGLVVPEALGHGTPVLTTTGTPWSELPETGSGWWIAPGAPALAAALESVLRLSRPELRAMGANGRKLVVERYSWSAIIDQHVQLYAWLAGARQKPSFILD